MYQIEANAPSCIGCPSGKYQYLAGQVLCEAVAEGFFISDAPSEVLDQQLWLPNQDGALSEDIERALIEKLAEQLGIDPQYISISGPVDGASRQRALSEGLTLKITILSDEGLMRHLALAAALEALTIYPSFWQGVNDRLVENNATTILDTSGIVLNAAVPACNDNFDFCGDAGACVAVQISCAVNPCPVGLRQACSQKSIGYCNDCTPGKYADELKMNCIGCPAGYRQLGTNAPSCDACPVGTYQMDTESFFCNDCQVNMITASEGTDDPGLCLCEANYYMEEIDGVLKCMTCIPGKYADELTMNCISCPAGYRQLGTNVPSCDACPVGTYQMDTESIYCYDCEANMITVNEGTDDPGLCLCEANYYLEEINGVRKCKTCPEGADCSNDGSSVRSLNTSVGYWRASTTTTVFHKCNDASACTGGPIYDSIDDQCNLGHVGLKCSLCDWPQQYALKYGVSCEPCAPNEGRNSVILCFAALLSAPIAIYLWLCYRAVRTGRSTSLGSLKELAWEMITAMQHTFEERSTIFKISVGFVQVLTRLGETYQLRFPVQVTLFFNCLQFLEFFDVFSFSSNLQCAHRPNHLQKIVVVTAGSMAVLAVLVLVSSPYVSACMGKICPTQQTDIVGMKKQKKFQVHPSAEPSSRPGQALDCRRVSDFLADRTLATSTPNIARDRWFRAYNFVVLELYQTGVLDKDCIPNSFKRAIVDQAVKREKQSVWNLILLFTFMIFPSCNSILLSWLDCQLYEDSKSYLVVDPQIVCYCTADAVHAVTLLVSDLECDTTIYNSTSNKWYVGFCTLLFVGGIPAMYAYILQASKQVLDPSVGIILRDGKKQQQKFELLRSRVGYRKAVQLVKLKARDKNLIASRTKFLW
jgi:hypothetical protein